MKSLTLAAVTALTLTSFGSAALADSQIVIKDAYARVASKVAKSGAAFFEIHNMGAAADRLIDVRTDVAVRSELHTHKETGDGIMQMLHVEEGFEVAAGGMHMLARGGDHVMMMGLNTRLDHGDTVNLVLVFEDAGEITVTVPVDLERSAGSGHAHHGKDDTHKHH